MKRLEGKVALISGTARGQGRAAAPRFAGEGALVVGGDLRHAEAVKTQRLIAREGGTALTPAPLDVTDEDSVRYWVEEAVDAFGGVDIAYAAAGAELDSVWLSLRAAWPHLVHSRGCILTLGTTAGRTGSPTDRRTALPALSASREPGGSPLRHGRRDRADPPTASAPA